MNRENMIIGDEMVEEETSVEKSKQFWKDLVQKVKDYAKEFGGKEGEDYVFREAEYSDKYKKPFFGFIKKDKGIATLIVIFR